MCKTERTKIVSCVDCREKRAIRADSKAIRCSRCAGAVGGRAKKPSRIRGRVESCRVCGRTFWTTPSMEQRFCSVDCCNAARRLERAEKAKRVFARTTANNAKRVGKIQREPCGDCGFAHAEMHNESYERPLEV